MDEHSWTKVAELKTAIQGSLLSIDGALRSIAISVLQLEPILRELDPEAETLPGAEAWAILSQALEDDEKQIYYLRRRLLHLEQLYGMGLVKSGGIGIVELADGIEDLALALWDLDQNTEAVTIYERFRDIAASEPEIAFDSDNRDVLEKMRVDAKK